MRIMDCSDIDAWWVGSNGDIVSDDKANYVLQVHTTKNNECYMLVPDELKCSDCSYATKSGHNHKFTVKGCYA